MPRWNRPFLEASGAAYLGRPVQVEDVEPPPGRLADVRLVGGVVTVRMAARLRHEPDRLGLAFLHELGHAALGHVAAPGDPRLAPAGSVLAEAVRVFADVHEREADAWAAERWAELSPLVRQVWTLAACDSEERSE